MKRTRRQANAESYAWYVVMAVPALLAGAFLWYVSDYCRAKYVALAVMNKGMGFLK